MGGKYHPPFFNILLWRENPLFHLSFHLSFHLLYQKDIFDVIMMQQRIFDGGAARFTIHRIWGFGSARALLLAAR